MVAPRVCSVLSLAILVCAGVALVRPVSAMKEHVEVSFDERVWLDPAGFGFRKGGELMLTTQHLEHPPVTLELIIVDTGQLLDRSYDNDDLSDVTFHTRYRGTNSRFRLPTWEAPESRRYFFLVRAIKNGSASATSVDAIFDLTCVNPGGQYLDTGYIPLPYLYVVFFVIVALLTLMWFANWVWHWRVRIRLHQVLSGLPIVMLGLLAVSSLEWWWMSREGTNSWILMGLSLALDLVFRVYFYMSLVLIAKGWCMTRPHLQADERRTLSFVFFGLVGAWILYMILLSFYVFFWLLMLLVVLRIMFVSVGRNMIALRGQLILVRQSGIDPVTTPVMRKYRMFRRFQITMMLYVFLVVIIYVLGLLFLFDYSWITELLLWLVYLVVFVLLGTTFRLKGHSPFYEDPRREGEGARMVSSDDVEALPPLRSSRLTAAELQGPELRPWEVGMELPPVPLHLFDRRAARRGGGGAGGASAPRLSGSVVVLENPDPSDSAGAALALGAPMEVQPTRAFLPDDAAIADMPEEELPVARNPFNEEEDAAYDSRRFPPEADRSLEMREMDGFEGERRRMMEAEADQSDALEELEREQAMDNEVVRGMRLDSPSHVGPTAPVEVDEHAERQTARLLDEDELADG